MTNELGVMKQDLPTNDINFQNISIKHFSVPCQTYQSYLSQNAYQTVTQEFKYEKGVN